MIFKIDFSKIFFVRKVICKGVVRVDYIINNNNLYFLEINTVPGMSKNSIIPQQVRAEGLNLTDFFSNIIENGMKLSENFFI